MTGSGVGEAFGGLVRVTVASDAHRADVALPSRLPLAELVPDLSLTLGLPLDADGTARVVTASGAALEAEASLGAQGVRDGALLTLVVHRPGDREPLDDPAEALGQALERHVPPWGPAAGKAVALVAAAAMLVLAAYALGAAGGPSAAVASAVVAAGLVASAGVADRLRGPDVARLLAWGAVVHSAVAGGVVGGMAAQAAALGAAPDRSLARFAAAEAGTTAGAVREAVVAGAGVGGLVAAAACLVVLPGARLALTPAPVLGLVAAAGGAVALATPLDPGGVAVLVLVAAALAGGPLTRVALALTRVRRAEAGDTGSRPGPDRGPEPSVPTLDRDEVEADAALAHGLVVALEVGFGLVVALLAPVVATRGPASAGLALCCGLVVLLRARRFRGAAPVLACVVSGATALVATAAAVLLTYPEARAALGLTLVAGATAVLATMPPRRPPGWHRVADLAESGGLVAIPSLLVAATGLLDRVAAAAASAA